MKRRKFASVAAAATAVTVLLNTAPLLPYAFADSSEVMAKNIMQNNVSIPASTTTLTFNNNGITASGTESGYKIEGTALTINTSGVYTITGSCAEGSITVKKGTTGVSLILQDLELTSSTTAPLSCNKTSEVTLYAVGSVVLTDKEDLANEESEDFEGAAIKVKSGSSLTITGTGTLTVDGSACKNGIKGAAESNLIIRGEVTLQVKAANHGIADDNCIIINSGTIHVTAGNDGIKAEPDEEDTASLGMITINGGTITVDAQGDGIQATGDVLIYDGNFDIKTFGGHSKAKSLGDDSAKGIKSDSEVVIVGGSFTLDSADDAIHSNGNVTLSGGSYSISAGDDALHADHDLTIDGGDIDVKTSYEAMEGARVILNHGTGNVISSDDGINAATDVSVDEIAIYLNGGTWTIDANGDGLDAGGDSSNNRGGYLYINGGKTTVFGASNGGNAGLDYDSNCIYKGGTLLVVDYSGMNQTPSSGTYLFFGSQGGRMGGMNQGGGFGNMGQQNGRFSNGQNSNSGNRQTFGPNNGGQNMNTEQGNPPTVPNAGFTDSQNNPMMNPNAEQTMGNQNSNISITKGSSIEIKDSNGNTIASATGTKNANCVLLCDETLVSGQSYSLYVNGTKVASATVSTGTTGQSGGINGQPNPSGHQNGSQQGSTSGSSNTTKPSPEMEDVSKDAWYAEDVSYVLKKGWMNGTDTKQFSPTEKTTRAMVVSVLYRMAGSPEVKGGDIAFIVPPFMDVPDGQWYTDAVLWAAENNISSGVGNGNFAPSREINREELSAFLYRFAQFNGYDIEKTADLTETFSDAEQVSSWAKQAVSWGSGSGLLRGVDGAVQPNATSDRSQLAAMLHRFGTAYMES